MFRNSGNRETCRTLGPLEARVLAVLWEEKCALTVRHLLKSFPELAYTTLMTTLDRLHRKGVLVRIQQGRAFSYKPRWTRSQLLGEMALNQVSDLLSSCGAGAAILSTLVHAVGRRDATMLDELDALVQAERARLKKENDR